MAHCMANNATFRYESDSVGTKEIPKNAYYGVHSLRAVENFSISGTRLHTEMINNLARLKKACAITNANAGVLDLKIADAIGKACDALVEGKFHDNRIEQAEEELYTINMGATAIGTGLNADSGYFEHRK